MKYYLIAGEASGDLHASHLMAALKDEDPEASFRGYGGNLMEAQGLHLMGHYRDMAYMGIIPVLRHASTILRHMRECQNDILQWQPDVVILVDYPGFNLKIARFVKSHSQIPVYYYISPKIWAWKEHRIKDIRRDVDELFSILPFEVEFFEGKHHYPIHYVGNPSVDEVAAYHPVPSPWQKPVIALLPGSRRQEIDDNLRRMLQAAAPFAVDYQLVVSVAPDIEAAFYERIIESCRPILFPDVPQPVGLHKTSSYDLLCSARAALVTSGTATLETALFRIPQVVCYYMKWGKLVSIARRLILKIPYISLVNLIAGSEVVPELVADKMTPANVHRHLAAIVPDGPARDAQLKGYETMSQRLGEPGAPQRAARLMVDLLQKADS